MISQRAFSVWGKARRHDCASRAKEGVIAAAEYVKFVHVGVLPEKHGELEDAIVALENRLTEFAALGKEIGDGDGFKRGR